MSPWCVLLHTLVYLWPLLVEWMFIFIQGLCHSCTVISAPCGIQGRFIICTVVVWVHSWDGLPVSRSEMFLVICQQTSLMALWLWCFGCQAGVGMKWTSSFMASQWPQHHVCLRSVVMKWNLSWLSSRVILVLLWRISNWGELDLCCPCLLVCGQVAVLYTPPHILMDSVGFQVDSRQYLGGM